MRNELVIGFIISKWEIRSRYNASSYEENEEEYIDKSLESDGIIVIYCNSQYKKKVKIVVNSRLLLADGKIGSDKLIQKLNKNIKRYLVPGFSQMISPCQE